MSTLAAPPSPSPARIRRSAPPLLAAAVTLAAGVAHAAPQPSQVRVIDVGLYPEARCNNGEPATYNYRLTADTNPADGDHRKKWLVVLSGGGSCTDYATCAARWHESAQGPNLDGGPGGHQNMVPDRTPRDFDGHGILDFDGEAAAGGGTVGAHANPFAGSDGTDGFNRLWINYCSSDTWSGLGTDVPVQAVDFPRMAFDPTNAALTHLHFGGAKIVDAVIATIMRGEVEGAGAAARPDLIPDGVDGEIVLAGSSAGGIGTIRNLDTVAHDVATGVVDRFDAAPGVVVYGVIDAATAVGPLPDSGDHGNDVASFYTTGQPDQTRNDDDCVDATSHRCYSTAINIVRDEISTPYFVVQQAFDMVIHGDLKVRLAAALAGNAGTLQAQFPALYAYAATHYGGAAATAEAYIRFMITTQADSIGVARNNKAGLFIPNYDTGWHQLMADSKRFYTSEAEQWTGADAPGSPRLGPHYAGTTVSIPTALGQFRQCVLGNLDSASYNACVSTIQYAAVDQNARVINTTAIP